MQWLSKEGQRSAPPYAQVLLQGHGQFETVDRKFSLCVYLAFNTNEHKTSMENITMENIWWNTQSDTIFEIITSHNTIFTEQCHNIFIFK